MSNIRHSTRNKKNTLSLRRQHVEKQLQQNPEIELETTGGFLQMAHDRVRSFSEAAERGRVLHQSPTRIMKCIFSAQQWLMLDQLPSYEYRENVDKFLNIENTVTFT